GFIGLVERLMAKDPVDRPSSAAAAEEELRGWAAGEVVEPLDSLVTVPFDETDVITEGGGSSEYSLISLPVVESPVDQAPPYLPDPPPRRSHVPLMLLAVSTAVLLMGGLLALLLVLASRR